MAAYSKPKPLGGERLRSPLPILDAHRGRVTIRTRRRCRRIMMRRAEYHPRRRRPPVAAPAGTCRRARQHSRHLIQMRLMKHWQPLLTGSLAERARQVVDEIAAVLAPAPAAAAGADQRPDVPGDPEPTAAATGEPLAAPEALAEADAYLSNPTLAGGLAGAALFFAYRAGRGGGPGAAGDSDAAALLLERCTEALATTPLAPDLYGGFSGVAWTAEHLYGPRFAAEDPRSAAAPQTSPGTETPQTPETPEAAEDDAEDPLAEIDDALLHYLDRSPWTADYDLIRGLAGYGVYALERLPRPSAIDCLTKIVDRLAETAEHGPQGTIWHTAPELLPDWQRAIFPRGYYNLGVAHGVPAVVAMLDAA